MSNVRYKNADSELTIMGSDEFVLVCLDHPHIKRIIQHLTPELICMSGPAPEEPETDHVGSADEEQGQYVQPTIYRNREHVFRTMEQMKPGQWTLLRGSYGTFRNYRQSLKSATRRYNIVNTDRTGLYRVECVR